ncbi:alkaline phosphatase D family protein [Bdellovibrio bacteriovorus]|uniref:alkaline phosphatase D family protein n=1 Tax=Bdellovibrio bacteriovorus TaxID=959 RepID=UPI0035A638A4
MKKILLLSLFILGCAQTTKHDSGSSTSATYVSSLPSQEIVYEKPVNKIAFGSCANQDQPEPLWKDVLQAKPDLFLFMGDNVYASHPAQQPIAEQYRKMDQIPEYIAIRKEVPFMATWDDHDFGERDGGADFKGKDNARRDFLNYWGYVKNSIPLEQKGIYHAKMIGPKKKSVQVIMLDTRYFRSPLKERPGNEGKAQDYIPQDEGTILGEAQWEWLETQLKRPAEVRFIVSSIQLIANDPKYEKWGNFPKERQRFFDLLKSTRAKNVILLSGDRHIASISKMDLKNYGSLYEITSSSINRANKYSDADSHYVGPVYSKENFGLADIDWKKKLVTVDIRGFNNEVVNSVKIKLR